MNSVLQLAPDILVVPECDKTAPVQQELEGARQTGFEWVGRISSKGLGIFSFGDYRLSLAGFYNPNHRFVVPLEVQGPMSFLLLAVWTVPDEIGSYVRPLVEAWKEYTPQIRAQNVVIAGDFNASVQFRGKPNFHFSVFLNLVAESGVCSLYHETTDEPHGQEKAPTFFLYRKRERPFHIDYMFAGAGLRSRLKSFRVGNHEDWAVHSDHMPLSAHFEAV